MPVLSTFGAMAARGFGWLSTAVTGIGYQAWAWGGNSSGQLGDGTTVNKSSPIQIGASADVAFIAVAASGSAAYIKNNGTLWMFGSGLGGVLGQGNTTSYSSPVQVGTGTTWAAVAVGSSITRAIKTDGTLWAWGDNTSGQLGDGTIVSKSSPVQIGALTNWAQVAGGTDHSFFLKTNNTIWATGSNASGQLGLGDTTNRSSPVQIGALTTWARLGAEGSGSFAIKTDGTLWAWGQAFTYGGLGLNDTTGRSSPVQVGTLTTWASIQRNGDRQCIAAIKTDGTLWAWGFNNSGGLGLGDTISRSSPVQVGIATNWSYAHASAHMLAVTTSGQLYATGLNTSGQLGLGDTTSRSSLVQVGTATSWNTVAVGGSVVGQSLALRS
jgi:alpha-tubulin suppressor-like RCC1 family protein